MLTKQSEQHLPQCQQRGAYTVCGTKHTDRMPISRKDCGDYTTLAERIADKEGERARLRVLNREMRRQWRQDNPRSLGDNLLIAASIAPVVALVILWLAGWM